MGMDVEDIGHVVHIGAPKSLVSNFCNNVSFYINIYYVVVS